MKAYMYEHDWRRQARKVMDSGVVTFPKVGLVDPFEPGIQKVVHMKAHVIKEYPHGWFLGFDNGVRTIKRFLSHWELCSCVIHGNLLDLTVTQTHGKLGRPSEGGL